MKSLRIALLALLAFSFTTANAQVRIGYTNIELVLAYMPAAKTLENELGTYQRKLSEELKAAEDYANVKLEEYKALKQANRLSPADDEKWQKDLIALDADLRKKSEEAEFKLMSRRQELLQPIMDSLQAAIDGVAKDSGYTYILNQTTSAGVSTILYGPEEDDITEAVMKRLGIAIPEGE
jgi:outer membrane protein